MKNADIRYILAGRLTYMYIYILVGIQTKMFSSLFINRMFILQAIYNSNIWIWHQCIEFIIWTVFNIKLLWNVGIFSQFFLGNGVSWNA